MYFYEGLTSLVPSLNDILASGLPAALWGANLGTIPDDWEMVLGDISPSVTDWYPLGSLTPAFVPSGEEAVVQAATPQVIVNSTAEPVTMVGIWIGLAPSGGSTPGLLLAHLTLDTPVEIPPGHGFNVGPAPGLGNC